MTTVKQALDTDYFSNKLSLIIRDISQYTSEELSTELYRLANTASCKSALAEIEKCEPVAWRMQTHPRGDYIIQKNRPDSARRDLWEALCLCTAPQPREWIGLSDEAILEMCPYIDHDLLEEAFYRGARAVEDKLRELNTKG